MTSFRHLSAKKAWAELTAELRAKEKFGQIALLGLMLHSGEITRAQVVELANQWGIRKEDFRRFRTERTGRGQGPERTQATPPET